MSRQTERAEFRKAVKRGAGVAKQRKRAKAKAELQARKKALFQRVVVPTEVQP